MRLIKRSCFDVRADEAFKGILGLDLAVTSAARIRRRIQEGCEKFDLSSRARDSLEFAALYISLLLLLR